MSFYRITDPDKRDAMVADYVATRKRLKDRNWEERLGRAYRHQELEQQFQPILQSNEEMVEKFVKDMKPIKQEVESLSRYIKQEPEIEAHRKRRWVGETLADVWKERILTQNTDVDKSFGIRWEDGGPVMGNKFVQLYGDDIFLEGKLYKGTSGLWDLIAAKRPRSDYTGDDMNQYRSLLKATNVLHRNFDHHSPYPRSNGSWKWKHLLRNIWYEFKDQTPPVEDDDDEDDDNYDTADDDDTEGGGGIMEPVKNFQTYLQKRGKCYRVKIVAGDGLFLSPHGRRLAAGDGLYLKRGHNVYDAEGLLLGKDSPFKNMPILGWLL